MIQQGIKITKPRIEIIQELWHAHDHPDIELIQKRLKEKKSLIGIATIYRTLALLESANIVMRHEFKNGKSRYELVVSDHHDHLINVETGEVIEFNDPEIEELQDKIAAKLGFKLINHRLDLYGVPLKKETPIPINKVKK